MYYIKKFFLKTFAFLLESIALFFCFVRYAIALSIFTFFVYLSIEATIKIYSFWFIEKHQVIKKILLTLFGISIFYTFLLPIIYVIYTFFLDILPYKFTKKSSLKETEYDVCLKKKLWTTPFNNYDFQINGLLQVSNAFFSKKTLLNDEEKIVFSKIESIINNTNKEWNLNYKVLAQTSLGEVLLTPNKKAYRAINTKRVDFIIVDQNFNVFLAIEYQGEGGHPVEDSEIRDKIKKIALEKAGINVLYIYPNEKENEEIIRKKLSEFINFVAKTKLDVDFQEKDEAKKLGAKWDKAQKSWYIDNSVEKEPFKKWIITSYLSNSKN